MGACTSLCRFGDGQMMPSNMTDGASETLLEAHTYGVVEQQCNIGERRQNCSRWHPLIVERSHACIQYKVLRVNDGRIPERFRELYPTPSKISHARAAAKSDGGGNALAFEAFCHRLSDVSQIARHVHPGNPPTHRPERL